MSHVLPVYVHLLMGCLVLPVLDCTDLLLNNLFTLHNLCYVILNLCRTESI